MKTSIYYKALALCLLLLFAQGAAAVVFEVTTAEEFQAALTTAASNGGEDKILLASEVFRGNFYYFAEESSDLDISSKDTDSFAIIDADGKNFGLYIRGNDKSFNISIRHLVIQNGNNPADGGGLHLRQIKGEALLDSVIIADNKSSGSGGGVFSYGVEALKLVNSAIVRNTAQSGAAITNNRGITASFDRTAVTVESLRIEGNVATDVRVLDISAQSVNISRLSFVENATNQNFYPCIEMSTSSLLITESVFERNTCGRGVFDFQGFETLNFTKNTVRDNKDDYPGSLKRMGTFSSSGRLQMVNNFIDGIPAPIQAFTDSSPFEGKGIVVHGNLIVGPNFEFSSNGGTPDVDIQMTQNTLVNFSNGNLIDTGENTAVLVQNNIFKTENSEVDLALGSLVKSSILKNNIIEEYTGFWLAKEANLNRDPRFYDMETGDYHLASNSPAVDSGNNELLVSEEYDLDGNARIINGTVDIGAYERSTTALHPADSNGDQSISQAEFDAYNTAWRTNDTWPTAPSIIPIDFVTRAGYLLQKGGAYKNIGVGKPATWVPLAD